MSNLPGFIGADLVVALGLDYRAIVLPCLYDVDFVPLLLYVQSLL